MRGANSGLWMAHGKDEERGLAPHVYVVRRFGRRCLPVVSGVRRAVPDQPSLRVYRNVLRPARGRLRLRRCVARVDRGRAAQTSGATRRCCRSQRTSPTPRTSIPACTKLVRADNLARELGMKRLWVKDDSRQPDALLQGPGRRRRARRRPRARLLGAGLPVDRQPGQRGGRRRRAGRHPRRWCCIPSNLEQQKILTTAVYGGTLVAVDGNYDDINRLAGQIAGRAGGLGVRQRQRPALLRRGLRRRWASRSPSSSAGGCPSRSSSRSPPAAQLVKVDKGSPSSARSAWWIRRRTRSSAPRPTGCSPVSAAFKAGHDTVLPVRPNTVAKSLAIGNPADGPYVLDVTRRTGGAVEDVSDDEIIDGIRLLARTEGIFARNRRRRHGCRAAQAAGHRPARPGRGDGHLQHRRRAEDAGRRRSVVGPSVTIPPSFEAFQEFLEASRAE